MRRYRVLALVVTSMLALGSIAWTVAAQEDPRIAEIVEKMKANLEDEGTAYLDMDVEVKVNGQTQEKFVQELWVRGIEHFRLERTDGTVVVRRPDELIVYEARANLALHIPPETLEALGDEREAALLKLGLGGRESALEPIAEAQEHMTIVGEVFMGDAECWIVDVGEEAFPVWRKRLESIPQEFDIEWMQLTIDKELAIPRCTRINMIGPAALEIVTSIWTIEEDVEVPDEMLQYAPPADATIMVWTPEHDPDQMIEQFRETARARIIQRLQQQQQ